MRTIMPLSNTMVHHPAPVSSAPQPGAAAHLHIAVLAGFAVVTAALLWCSFFPLNLGFCAWFALVPLLILVRAQASLRTILLIAWIGGLSHYFCSLQWVRVAHPMMYFSWIGLTFYCSLYFPLSIWLLRRVDRFAPLTITVPIVWTSLEYLRTHFLTGFAWYFLGHTQHDYLPVIQVSDLAGVYAVTFVVAAANGMLAELLCRWPSLCRWLRLAQAGQRVLALPVQLGFVLVLVAGTLGYGVWRVQQTDFSAGPRVSILQSNLSQGMRNARHREGDEGENAGKSIMGQMALLTKAAKAESPHTDLIIWPETTCPFDWVDADPAAPSAEISPAIAEWRADRQQMLADIGGATNSNVLLGLNARDYYASDKARKSNTALLVDRTGKVLDRYDKIHCVPFGEYVPMRHTFPWLSVFTPYDYDYSCTPGTKETRFQLPTAARRYRFGVLICYEDSDAALARAYGRPDNGEPPVDFLVNISNDGWFDGTEEHEQHLAVSRFRAVESRRALVRAVNMGISGVIDGNGRVVALPRATWAESKKVDVAFSATVPLDQRSSFYARTGDWFPVGCAVLLGFGVLAGLGRGFGSRAK